MKFLLNILKIAFLGFCCWVSIKATMLFLMMGTTIFKVGLCWLNEKAKAIRFGKLLCFFGHHSIVEVSRKLVYCGKDLRGTKFIYKCKRCPKTLEFLE